VPDTILAGAGRSRLCRRGGAAVGNDEVRDRILAAGAADFEHHSRPHPVRQRPGAQALHAGTDHAAACVGVAQVQLEIAAAAHVPEQVWRRQGGAGVGHPESAPRAQHVAERRRQARWQDRAFVLVDHLFDAAGHADVALLQPDRLVGDPPQEVGAMRREHQDPRAVHEIVHALDDLLLEAGVAGADPLVHHQDVVRQRGRCRERKAHRHPLRIGLQRHVQVRTEPGEVGDRRQHRVDFLTGATGHQALEHQVAVTAGFLAEPERHVEDARDIAAGRHRSRAGVVDAGEHAQQAGLARAVVADQRQPVAAGQVDRHVVECAHVRLAAPHLDAAAERRALWMQLGVLVARGGQRELEGYVVGAQEHSIEPDRCQTQCAMRRRVSA
jgi:hypothetical protein